MSEFQRTKEVAHTLIDDLTVISGYAEIMIMRGGPEHNWLVWHAARSSEAGALPAAAARFHAR